MPFTRLPASSKQIDRERSSTPFHSHLDLPPPFRHLSIRYVYCHLSFQSEDNNLHLFACPNVPPPPAPPSTTPTPRLDHFIAYALHHTHLRLSVTFTALYLLQHLKAPFPAIKGSSGHRLPISASMLASKIICDDTYSNKSWCIVGQGTPRTPDLSLTPQSFSLHYRKQIIRKS